MDSPRDGQRSTPRAAASPPVNGAAQSGLEQTLEAVRQNVQVQEIFTSAGCDFTDNVWVQDLFVLKFEMEDECIELDQKVSHWPCSRQLYLTAAGWQVTSLEKQLSESTQREAQLNGQLQRLSAGESVATADEDTMSILSELEGTSTEIVSQVVTPLSAGILDGAIMLEAAASPGSIGLPAKLELLISTHSSAQAEIARLQSEVT